MVHGSSYNFTGFAQSSVRSVIFDLRSILGSRYCQSESEIYVYIKILQSSGLGANKYNTVSQRTTLHIGVQRILSLESQSHSESEQVHDGGDDHGHGVPDDGERVEP